MTDGTSRFIESADDGGCYIPLATSDRSRSAELWAEMVRRLDEDCA